MRFQLEITLTEQDYIDFNHFHTLESKSGRKTVRKSRLLLTAILLSLIVLDILILGWTTFSVAYAILLGLFTVFYMLLFKKLLKRNIKKQIQRLKETGKLPYDAKASLEFYEDKLVEITADKRTEQTYDALERICIVGERFIYLYYSSVGAYILPVAQIKEQLDRAQFLGFLTQKCSNVEYYK